MYRCRYHNCSFQSFMKQVKDHTEKVHGTYRPPKRVSPVVRYPAANKDSRRRGGVSARKQTTGDHMKVGGLKIGDVEVAVFSVKKARRGHAVNRVFVAMDPANASLQPLCSDKDCKNSAVSAGGMFRCKHAETVLSSDEKAMPPVEWPLLDAAFSGIEPLVPSTVMQAELRRLQADPVTSSVIAVLLEDYIVVKTGCELSDLYAVSYDPLNTTVKCSCGKADSCLHRLLAKWGSCSRHLLERRGDDDYDYGGGGGGGGDYVEDEDEQRAFKGKWPLYPLLNAAG
jgi:hypothetical protein